MSDQVPLIGYFLAYIHSSCLVVARCGRHAAFNKRGFLFDGESTT